MGFSQNRSPFSCYAATMDVETGERRVLALMRVGRAMASTADYGQALAALITTISELLDVETAGFMLYDPETSGLVLQQPAFGISDPELISAYHVSLHDGGNAVKVFLSRRPYMTNDAPDDPRIIRRYAEMFDARGILTVPLVVEDEAIGVCHAINKRSGPFTEDDLQLLDLIAPLLAVSVQSAWMFRDVNEKQRQLERAIYLQAELSRTAFDAPGVAPLTDRLAALVGRPVMVLDASLRALAQSGWPSEPRPDESWLTTSQSTRWWQTESRDGIPALTPIAVGKHFGGFLAVLDTGRPLDQIDARAIEHAATIFALEMLRERSAYELELRLKGDLLQTLFSGNHHDETETRRLLADLGYTIVGPWRVANMQMRWRIPRPTQTAKWTDQIRDPHAVMYPALQQICYELLGARAVAPWRTGFLMLIPAATGDAERDRQIAEELLRSAEQAAEQLLPGTRVHLGVSSVISTVRALGEGSQEADQAVAAARTMNTVHRPVLFEHLGIFRVLRGGPGSHHHADFIDQAIGPLERHDAASGSELVHTLSRYVDADFNAAEAARRLYVHPNTLAYRLRAIRRLLGGDPAKGDLRMQVELALKLHALSRGEQ